MKDRHLPQAQNVEKLEWQYMGGFSARLYGMLRFSAFSYLDIVDTRLHETPNSEYPNYILRHSWHK